MFQCYNNIRSSRQIKFHLISLHYSNNVLSQNVRMAQLYEYLRTNSNRIETNFSLKYEIYSNNIIHIQNPKLKLNSKMNWILRFCVVVVCCGTFQNPRTCFSFTCHHSLFNKRNYNPRKHWKHSERIPLNWILCCNGKKKEVKQSNKRKNKTKKKKKKRKISDILVSIFFVFLFFFNQSTKVERYPKR